MQRGSPVGRRGFVHCMPSLGPSLLVLMALSIAGSHVLFQCCDPQLPHHMFLPAACVTEGMCSRDETPLRRPQTPSLPLVLEVPRTVITSFSWPQVSWVSPRGLFCLCRTRLIASPDPSFSAILHPRCAMSEIFEYPVSYVRTDRFTRLVDRRSRQWPHDHDARPAEPRRFPGPGLGFGAWTEHAVSDTCSHAGPSTMRLARPQAKPFPPSVPPYPSHSTIASTGSRRLCECQGCWGEGSGQVWALVLGVSEGLCEKHLSGGGEFRGIRPSDGVTPHSAPHTEKLNPHWT